MAVRILLVVLAAFAVLGPLGCGQASSPAERQERDAGVEEPEAASLPTSEPAPTTSSAGGRTVGEVVSEVDLRPVGDSGVSGTAVFKEVGSLGVQVELEVSGLPDPEEPYYAQVHEGSCSEAPRGGGQEREDDHGDDHPGHEHEHGGLGPSLTLVRLGTLVKVGEFADHAEYEPPPADELPGNVDQPVGAIASADGTTFVTTLLEGVESEQLSSGGTKYLDLRAPSHEAPEHWSLLACADLS